jgi:tetratricopeptide (TPR) repeat protein
LLYYLDTSQTEKFKLLANEVQNQLSSSTDPGKRLRYYRNSVYLSYLLLEQNNLSQAKDEIASAVRELQGLGRFRTEEELLSQVYLEIANYYRTKRSLQTAKEYLLEALKLNPNNMIARSTYESYFLEDAPS